jgi:hypothetical protein
VLWIGRGAAHPWLAPLRATLREAGRIWAPELQVLSVPTAASARNPWTFKPDQRAPLRWSMGGVECTDLAELRPADASADGLVLDGVLAGLGAQAARTMLQQCAALLAPDAPWLLLEPNGRFLPAVVANLRRPEAERGEGRGTLRAVEELRRLLEPAGLGLERACALPAGRGRLARAARGLLGRDLAAPWLVVLGRRI